MRKHLLVLLLVAARSAGQDATAEAIEAARRGGVVIACRHGITNPSDPENEHTLRYDDPAFQRRLAPAGEQQARQMGEAFKRLGVGFGEVIASPMQRARRSAELMAGAPQLDSLWHTRGDNYAARRAARLLVLATPVAAANRLIVSHVGTLQSVLRFRGSMQEGDCVVVRPRGGGHEVIGLVPWRAWLEHGVVYSRSWLHAL